MLLTSKLYSAANYSVDWYIDISFSPSAPLLPEEGHFPSPGGRESKGGGMVSQSHTQCAPAQKIRLHQNG